MNGHGELNPLEESTSTIDTGKGKFGMSLQFVSHLSTSATRVDSQSPDGAQLASSTENGYVTIIDVETQTVVASYQSHALAVRALSWSHDSQVGDSHFPSSLLLTRACCNEQNVLSSGY